MRRVPFVTMLLAVALAVLPAGPAAAKDKTFLVREDRFFDRVHSVVLLPCKVPESFIRSDSMRVRADSVVWQIDSLLVAGLGEAKLKVTSARVARAAYEAIVDSLGGLYDESTGAPDTARFEFARRELIRRLVRDYAPDAFVSSGFYHSVASFKSGMAKWDGVSQAVTHETAGGMFKKTITLRRSDWDWEGKVSALSLAIRILTADGELLYQHDGGFQLMNTLEKAKFVAIPEGEHFRDRERATGAVRAAINPLLDAAGRRYSAVEKYRP